MQPRPRYFCCKQATTKQTIFVTVTARKINGINDLYCFAKLIRDVKQIIIVTLGTDPAANRLAIIQKGKHPVVNRTAFECVAAHINLSRGPPPYGGEQGRKGGKPPYPLKGILGAYTLILTAEPQYRLGTFKRSQLNVCRFVGVTPPILGPACSMGL